MKLKKFWLTIVFLLLFSPMLLASSCILNKTENHVGWNIQKLEKQLDAKETFAFYFGTNLCSFCRSVKKILKENPAVQKAIKDFKNNADAKYAFYWYSEDILSPKHKKRYEFAEALKTLFDRKNYPEISINSVPLIVFFKKGQFIAEISGNNNVADDTVKYLKELAVE